MAAKKSTKKEQSFEDKLWDTAELLRGKVAPSTYKDVALGLLFLKFISYWFDQRREEIKENNKDASEKELEYLLNLKDSYSSKGVFFLKEGDKWDDLVKVVSSEKNLPIKVDNMIQEIENDNLELEGVLPKVFAQSEIKNDNLHQLIENFDSISTHEISKDSFGRIYEYFLRSFSKKLGEKGGEFFTPESIVQLLVEIIEPYEGIIYDPTCGSGGMFVQSYKFLQAHQNEKGKEFVEIGTNYKISDIQSAIGRAQLKKIEKIIKNRQTMAKNYSEMIEKIENVEIQKPTKNSRHTYQTFTCVITKPKLRDRIISKLAEKHIETQIGTYALHCLPAFKKCLKDGNLINSEFLFKNTIALPMHEEITVKDQEYICKSIEKIIKNT